MLKVTQNGNTILEATQNYDYRWELISLIARICIMIILEVGIAIIFFRREKLTLAYVAIINVITQIILNVQLNITNFYYGPLRLARLYMTYEIHVVIIEAVLLILFARIKKKKDMRWGKIAVYVIVSNVVSYGAGLALAKVIPGIF